LRQAGGKKKRGKKKKKKKKMEPIRMDEEDKAGDTVVDEEEEEEDLAPVPVALGKPRLVASIKEKVEESKDDSDEDSDEDEEDDIPAPVSLGKVRLVSGGVKPEENQSMYAKYRVESLLGQQMKRPMSLPALREMLMDPEVLTQALRVIGDPPSSELLKEAPDAQQELLTRRLTLVVSEALLEASPHANNVLRQVVDGNALSELWRLAEQPMPLGKSCLLLSLSLSLSLCFFLSSFFFFFCFFFLFL
jgi:hypothetical protein